MPRHRKPGRRESPPLLPRRPPLRMPSSRSLATSSFEPASSFPRPLRPLRPRASRLRRRRSPLRRPPSPGSFEHVPCGRVSTGFPSPPGPLPRGTCASPEPRRPRGPPPWLRVCGASWWFPYSRVRSSSFVCPRSDSETSWPSLPVPGRTVAASNLAVLPTREYAHGWPFAENAAFRDGADNRGWCVVPACFFRSPRGGSIATWSIRMCCFRPVCRDGGFIDPRRFVTKGGKGDPRLERSGSRRPLKEPCPWPGLGGAQGEISAGAPGCPSWGGNQRGGLPIRFAIPANMSAMGSHRDA